MENTPAIWLFFLLSTLGFFSILNRLTSLLQSLFHACLRPSRNLTTYGSWALITGATDGIGKSFAFRLAHEELNLILVSRNYDKLKSVSMEIISKFPHTKVKIVVLDFSKDVFGNWVEVIEGAIKGLDVGVLINNVGITYPKAMFFHEVEEEDWMNVVRVNLEGTTWVTKAVIPKMLEKKKGAIVNIGSCAGSVLPSHPLYAIYAATKAYIDQFSRSLHVEYKRHRIDVQCQVPLYVATNMASKAASLEESSFFIPSPDAYVAAAIRRIGYESVCIPYWPHVLQCFCLRLLPEVMVDAWRFSIGTRRREKYIIKPAQSYLIIH